MDNQELDNNNIEEKIVYSNTIEEEPKDISLSSEKKKKSPLLITFGVLSILSFVGVIVLLCLFFCGDNKSNNVLVTPKPVQTGELRIAYVRSE